MGVEIERKFRVVKDWPREGSGGQCIRQGYLRRDADCTVRVRWTGAGGFLTIKGRTRGATRPEFEVSIPPDEAAEMLALFCGDRVIEKRRHRVAHAGHVWEIDEFQGANEGLILAEVELASEDESLVLPEWVGEEVTGDPRFYNASLVQVPFSRWGA